MSVASNIRGGRSDHPKRWRAKRPEWSKARQTLNVRRMVAVSQAIEDYETHGS